MTEWLLTLPSAGPAAHDDALAIAWRTLTLQGGRLTTLVLLGTALLGIAGGLVGTLLLLRKRSLMGDAISHATLPGIAVAFLGAVSLGLNPKSMPILMLGGAGTAILAVVTIHAILRLTRLREDAAIAAVLSVFFGAGIVLMTVVQSSPSGQQGGLRGYIFGQASAMSASDVWTMAALAVAAAAIVAALFKELTITCFDDAFARATGWPVGAIDLLMMTLVVVVTLAGMQQVGLVLVIAMLIVPAAAARFWSDRVGVITVLAAAFGGLSGYLGAAASAVATRLPTGGVIVLTAGAVFVVSLLAAPRRGVIATVIRRLRLRASVALDHRVVQLAGNGSAVSAVASRTPPPWLAVLLRLRGLASRTGAGLSLTPAGAARASRVSAARAQWHDFITSQAGVASSHAAVSADLVEHVLAKPQKTGIPPVRSAPHADTTLDPEGRR